MLTADLAVAFRRDDALQPIAQADMDHQDTLSLWCETTVKKNMQDILAHP